MIELLMTGQFSYIPPVVTGAYFFRTEQEALWYQTSAEPLSGQDILNNWPRASQTTYFADPANATGDSADWQYVSSSDSFLQPNNASNTETLLSPETVENYTFESVLTSDDTDNDLIGLVAAMKVDSTGEAMMVIVWVDANSNSFDIGYLDQYEGGTGANGINTKAAGSPPNAADSNNWNGQKIKVKIVRTGDIISAKCSPWNSISDVYDSTEITLDLNTLPNEGSNLTGPSKYGFATRSQPNSTYEGFVFRSSGTGDDTKVYAENTNKRWVYSSGSWTQDGTAYADFSDVDIINSLPTKEVFTVDSSSISFDKNNGIPYGNANITVASDGETIPQSDITSQFTYPETLTVTEIHGESENITVTLDDVSGDITVTPNSETSGFFYVKLETPETTDPETGVSDKDIAFRRCDFTVS